MAFSVKFALTFVVPATGTTTAPPVPSTTTAFSEYVPLMMPLIAD
jgi:hypothetical protein